MSEFVKKFVPGDIEGLTIDTVILSDILEHVEDDVDLLRKAGSYARYVLVNVPMERCWLTRNRNYGKNDISGHLRAYDLPHVKRIIHEAGLTIMDYDIRCLMKEPVYRRRYFKSSKSFLKSLLITWPKYLLKRLLLLLYPHYASRNFFALLTRNNHHEKT